MAQEEEDYGDYVTRCICGFTHDDGYMICCDQCSVWQHVECMKVNPKNLPDKYLCEQCEPRTVDKKKARLIQLKKKEDMSDFDEDDSSSERSHSASPSGGNSHHPPSIKKRKKAHRTSSGGTLRVHELKAEARRNRKDKGDKGDDGKRGVKKKSKHSHSPHHRATPPPNSMMSGLQQLLTAASALEEQQQRNSRVSEQASNSMFNCTASPWRDPYKTVDSNQYTDVFRAGLKDHLTQLKNEAVVYSKEEYNALGTFPLCLVRDVGSCRKGLVSEAHIPEDEMILEYKGNITLKDALCKEMELPHQLLWKEKPCPFVFQYDRMSRLMVCLDARHYGNTARFIRRSCNPNAEVRHFFVGDDVHFGVYATNHVSPEEEVTLPFDFPSDKCDYPIECACKRRGSCLLISKNVKIKKVKKEPKNEVVSQQEGVTESGDVPISSKKANVKGRMFPLVDEDSNSSWTSTGSFSRKRLKRTCSQSSTSQQNSRDPTDSESEDLDGDGSKKKKSREERKTEAVWKMFERMETTRRKKLSSVSESNLEETVRSSPGYSSPRGEIKERRISGNSRKVQLLPSGKHRLSSLSSSVDLLSPEHPDAFSSPPLTPSLSFTPHYQSHELLPHSDTTSSLIPPPFATLPKLSFEVTPYLHPKYLLADFALPRKKAILRQWEMEQREMTVDDGDNGHWMTNGFALACMKAMEGYRPRQRGCLKHRWMDMHSKELQDESEMFSKLPHKKRFLQKWLESSTETQPTSTSIGNLTPPPSSSSSPSLSGSISDNKIDLSEPTHMPTISDTEDKPSTDHTSKPHPPPGDTSVPSSPLFDDFSDDDDFEDISEQHERGGERREKAHKHRKDIRHSYGKEGKSLGFNENQSIGAVKPPSEPNDKTISPLSSLPSVKEDISSAPDPPTVTSTSELGKIPVEAPCLESMETSIQQDRDVVLPKLEIISEVTEKGSGFQKKPEVEIAVEEISGEEDNPESVEMDISSSPLPPAGVTDEQDMNFAGRDKSVFDSSVDGMEKSLFLSPLNDSNSKPGGAKRKMSLLEYRSRARKPSEQMQRKPPSQDASLLGSIMTTPTPPPPSTCISVPPTNPPSHSFLSYSSSFLSGSSNRTVKPPLAGVGSPPTRLFDTGSTQFEPVSPEEDDKNPPIEDAPLKRPSSLTTLPPPPPPPPPPSTNQPSSMPYNVPHTPTNIVPGQQLMWGGHPPGNPMDMAQDPRRVHQPPGPNPDMFMHHPPPPTHQTPMSPQELMRPHYPPPHSTHPVPYTPIMHHQQIRAPPMGGEYVPCGPHTPGGSSGNMFVQPHPRVPHPSLLHQPPPRHPNSSYYQ